MNTVKLLTAENAGLRLRALDDFAAAGKFDDVLSAAQEAKKLLGTSANDNMTAAERGWYRAELSLAIARSYLVDGDASNMADALLDGINGLADVPVDEKRQLKLAQLNYLLGLARLSDSPDSLDVVEGQAALDSAVEIYESYQHLAEAIEGLACAQTVRWLGRIKDQRERDTFIPDQGDKVYRELERLYHSALTANLHYQAILLAHVCQLFYMNSFADNAKQRRQTSRGWLTAHFVAFRRTGWPLSRLAFRLRWMKPDATDPDLWDLARHSI